MTDKLLKEIISPIGMFVIAATALLPPDYLNYTMEMASEGGDPAILKRIVQHAQKGLAEKGFTPPLKIEGLR